MAYLRPIPLYKCEHGFCGKKATVQLIDRWNGERGRYCLKHGKVKVVEQAKSEAANDGRP